MQNDADQKMQRAIDESNKEALERSREYANTQSEDESEDFIETEIEGDGKSVEMEVASSVDYFGTGANRAEALVDDAGAASTSGHDLYDIFPEQHQGTEQDELAVSSIDWQVAGESSFPEQYRRQVQLEEKRKKIVSDSFEMIIDELVDVDGNVIEPTKEFLENKFCKEKL